MAELVVDRLEAVEIDVEQSEPVRVTCARRPHAWASCQHQARPVPEPRQRVVGRPLLALPLGHRHSQVSSTEPEDRPRHAGQEQADTARRRASSRVAREAEAQTGAGRRTGRPAGSLGAAHKDCASRGRRRSPSSLWVPGTAAQGRRLAMAQCGADADQGGPCDAGHDEQIGRAELASSTATVRPAPGSASGGTAGRRPRPAAVKNDAVGCRIAATDVHGAEPDNPHDQEERSR